MLRSILKFSFTWPSMKICQTSGFFFQKSKAINWCIFEDSHQFLSEPRLFRHHTQILRASDLNKKIMAPCLAPKDTYIRAKGKRVFYAKNVMRKLILWQVVSHMFFPVKLDWIYVEIVTYLDWRLIQKKNLVESRYGKRVPKCTKTITKSVKFYKTYQRE